MSAIAGAGVTRGVVHAVVPSVVHARMAGGGVRFTRSYGHFTAPVQIVAAALAAVMVAAVAVAWPAAAAERPVRIVALVIRSPPAWAFPAARPFRPSSKWRSAGPCGRDRQCGVSGDTASGGLARLDWAVPAGTDAVIVELGANDMLRGSIRRSRARRWRRSCG